MSRLIAYKDVVRQRVRWNKARKAAKAFAGDELRGYAQVTALEYERWIDLYFDGTVDAIDALEQVADHLMQLQAIQDVLEERAGLR